LLIELINKCEIKYTNIIKFNCDIFNYDVKIIFDENKPYLRKLSKFNKLTHLTVGYKFNKLIHLTFGYKFNKLTHLTFGYKFNKLTHLTFGYKFN
jgi:hypothetical protein